MSALALPLAGPTRTERRLLHLTARLTVLVERRIANRAEQRALALEMLRDQQTRRHDPHAVDHLLAQVGLPYR